MNIKEIAKSAGVSVATISRVMNHPEQVLPETRDHVLAVMREYNYTPNWFARGLNLGRTNTIALLVPNIKNRPYQELIEGIETVVRNKHFAVIFCHTSSDPARELEYLKMVESRRIDGVILVSSALKEEQVQAFVSTHIPCVHIGKKSGSAFDYTCYIDVEEGTFRLILHLHSLGHTSFGLLVDERFRGEADQMIDGCRRALYRTGLSDQALRIYSCSNSIHDAYNFGLRLFDTEGDPPRALITFSDDQAYGVLKAASDSDIAVPERLALATLMDSAMCSIVSPAVTGVEQPSARLGMVAARMLFDRIEGTGLEDSVPQEIVLQSKLKIRRSCGNRQHIYELFE